MTALEKQIASLLVAGENVGEIAAAMEVSESAVKVVARGLAREERALVAGGGSELDFTSDDIRNAKKAVSTLIFEDDPHVKLRAAKFVIEHQRERQSQHTANLEQVNRILQTAAEAAQRHYQHEQIKGTGRGIGAAVIDVEAEPGDATGSGGEAGGSE